MLWLRSIGAVKHGRFHFFLNLNVISVTNQNFSTWRVFFGIFFVLFFIDSPSSLRKWRRFDGNQFWGTVKSTQEMCRTKKKLQTYNPTQTRLFIQCKVLLPDSKVTEKKEKHVALTHVYLLTCYVGKTWTHPNAFTKFQRFQKTPVKSQAKRLCH